MKRCYLLAATLLFWGLYSCQNDALTDDPVQPAEKPATTYELSNEEVTELLSGYFQCLENGNPSTRGSKPEITSLSKVRYDNPVTTRSGNTENNGFTICTVDINNGGKEGFAIVVADKRLPVVLAYSPNGKFSELKEKGSENLQKYVADIPDDVKSVLADPRYLTTDLTDTSRMFKGFPYYNDRDEIYESVDIKGIRHDVALLKESVLWGQRSPYNDSLPINPTTGKPYPVGCVNVALSQIMAYYKYPSLYDWELMASLVNVENNPFASAKMVKTISTFVRDLTILTGTRFKDSTDAAVINIPEFIKSLDTLNFVHSPAIYYNSDAVRNSLKQKKFVVAFGKSYSGAGHAYVLSGYWKFKIPQDITNLQDGTNLGVNWGTAGGWGDGWYLVEYGNKKITDLGLAKIDPYTGEWGTDYSYNLVLVTGICPVNY